MDVPAAERAELLRRKLTLCSATFEFRTEYIVDEPNAAALKNAKRETLLELIEFVNTKKSFPEEVYKDTLKMVKVNLFQPLPPTPAYFSQHVDEEESPVLQPSWPHLQLVYEFFLRFVVSSDVDPKAAKKVIDKGFIAQLLVLFESEDPRERDYLKTILHRIYGKFMSHRPFIRRSMAAVFYCHIYESERDHAGISELLEIMGSVINGFALPLKEEHVNFLQKALIPLLKPPSIEGYLPQLSYCISQFAEKDPALAEHAIRGLLSYWPTVNSQKCVQMLNVLEELVELASPEGFAAVLPALSSVLIRALQSPNFQVAERSLFLWQQETFQYSMGTHYLTVIPAFFGPLATNVCEHWSMNVRDMSASVQKLLMEMDSDLYDAEARRYAQSKDTAAAAAKEAARHWEIVMRQAGVVEAEVVGVTSDEGNMLI